LGGGQAGAGPLVTSLWRGHRAADALAGHGAGLPSSPAAGRPVFRVRRRPISSRRAGYSHLPPETHGRMVAQSPSHLWRGRYPSRAGPVFYSTFEQLDLPGCSGPRERRDVQKHFEPTPTPTLYVGRVSNVLGRVPLMPLFLKGIDALISQGSCAVDALVSPLQRYIDDPRRAPLAFMKVSV
jgi:hypothetical protein